MNTVSEQTRYLIIEGNYGLCNRLMALASYAPIADFTGRCLRIHWAAREQVGGCEFDELFENELAISDMRHLKVRDSLRGLYLTYGVLGRDESDLEKINQIPDYPERVVGVTMSCYFEPSFLASNYYHQSVRDFLVDLRPVASIRAAISRFCSQYQIYPDNESVIGLHVRRTDGQREAQRSTNEQFSEIVSSHLSHNPSTRFFLATDCAVTEAFFRRQFPGAMICCEKRFLPGQLRGTAMDEAMLDLYVLANTHFIYGSYGSSFSKVASLLRGCAFHQVGFDPPLVK